ncbi:MAG: YkoF family thiamine/hydroxymethylpyrimidine-binding protein [Limnochordia bacterium]
MLLAQVALYPVEAEDADQVINSSLEELDQSGTMHFNVGPVSTEIQGEADEVFSALQRLFERACRDGGGEVSMVATVTNARR